MAGYLGKISAVVTANTADFTSKLNSASGTVKKFAGEVQGNITTAMKDADRALKSVLTPLQTLQASLKAASSQGLNFKGFDGAIRDIEGLKARMQTLKGANVKLVLDASGFKSIDSYRNALDGLTQRGAKILLDVGGLDKVKEIQATLAASGDKTIKIGLAKINRSEIDSLVATVDKLGEKKIKAVFDVLGQSDLDAAVLKTQQLFSASEQLAKPLGRAVAEFDKLSYAVQAGFIPALSLTQNAVQQLETNIRDGARVGVGEFDRLEKQVVKTAAAIQRMSEVAGLVGKIKTGQELAFQDPKMVQRLSRAATQGDQAAALPADTLASNKTIAPLIAEANNLAQKIAEVDARIQGFGDRSFFTTGLKQQLAALNSALDSVNEKVATQLTIELNAAKAIADANTLKEKLASLATTLSGQQTDPFERIAASAKKAKAAVDALDDGAAKTALQGKLGLGQQQLERMSKPEFVGSPKAMGVAERGFDRLGAEAAVVAAAQVKPPPPPPPLLGPRAGGIDSVNDITSQMALLQSSTIAAKGQLEQLPISLRTKFVPAIQAAEVEFYRLKAAAGATSEEIENAGNEVTRLKTAMAAAGSANLGPRAGGIDSGNDITNQMALLKSSTIAAKAQLDQLPISLRSRFVPAIQAAEVEFYRLSRAAGATSEEIQNAGNEVTRLKTAMSAAGSIKMSGAVINDGAIATSIGRLNGMQQILLKVGATAGGPVAAAYDRLARAQARVLSSGSAGTPAATQSLRRYEEAAIRAAVATGEISRAEAKRLLAKAGDRGRGGMDRFSMAANQAAFLVDDFFSSVGGFDQKLRAISNNVTQLGFVLGGTTGLFVGLGAVLAGQVSLGIYKWINAGRTSEDQTKALNEALSKQKSLVDDLAQSFRGLADAIGKGMFSEAASTAIDFGKDVGAVARKQKELRDSRRIDIDPAVQKERASQARDQRLMDKSESIPERIVLARQIRESKQREIEASSAVVNRDPTEAARKVRGAIQGSIERRLNASVDFESPDAPLKQEANRQKAIEAANALPQGNSAQDIATLRSELAKESKALAEAVKTSAGGVDQSDSTLIELETLIKDLEDPMHAAIDKLSLEIVSASNDAAQQIAAAQKDVASAIERGVPGAIAFQRELDENAARLASANDTLAQASNISVPEERQRAMDVAQGDVKIAEENLAETEAKRRSVRLGMTQGGERTKDALSSLQSDRELMNSRAVSVGRDKVDKENAAREKAGTSSGKLARALKEEEDAATAKSLAAGNFNANQTDANDAAFEAAQKALIAAQEKLAAAMAASGVDDRALEIAQAESEAAAALMDFTRAMEESVSRIRKIAADALSTSTQLADKAQRDLTEQKPVAQGGLPPAELKARRDKAEADLLADQKTTTNAQSDITKARELAQLEDPRVQAANAKLERIKQQRKADEEAMLELRAQGTVTPAQERDAIEREDLRRRQEAAAQQEQASAVAANAGVQAAQGNADKAAQDIDKRRQNQEAAAAGRDLALTPRARQEQEMATSVNQLLQRGLEIQAGPGNAERSQIINDGAKNIRAQAAPMIEAMNNSRLSAILEGNNGPSRQALKVSDVNTMEGQSEMNRLLRGDDAAKNVDLEELRKQTQALNDLNKLITDAKRELGVA